MFLIDDGTQGPTSLPTKQPSVGTPGFANSGTPGSISPTRWNADVANTIMSELAGLVTTAGMALDRTNNTQLVAAVPKVVSATANTWSATQTYNANVVFNNNNYIYGKDTGGSIHLVLGYGADNYVHMYSGTSGFVIGNSSATINSLLLDNSGNCTIYGAVTAGAAASIGTTLAVGGAATVTGLLTGLAGLAIAGNGTFTGALYPTGGALVGAVSNPIASVTNGFQVISNGSAQLYNNSVIPFAIGVGNTALSLTSFYYSTSIVGSISTNGSSTAYNVTSDYRIKETFGPAAAHWLSSIPVYDAAYKAAPDVRMPMVLAHELAALAPFAVSGAKDAVDADGAPVFQQVDWFSMQPAIIAYIQSLEKRLDALERNSPKEIHYVA